MNLDVKKLPDDPSHLKTIVVEKQKKILLLEEHIRLLKNELFGRRSEKHLPMEDDPQRGLFEDPDDEQNLEPAGEPAAIDVPGHKRRKAGRKPLPADLPRVEVIHDLDEAEKQCGCGLQRSCIGQEVSEKLDIIPATIRVIRHIRYKYACKECEGVDSNQPAVKIAPAPKQLLPKSMATAGLVAHIAVAKFEDALPLYRQEKQFARLGIDLPRATMASWLIKTAGHLLPLVEICNREIRSGPLINIDETTIQVLDEPGRSNTSKSYMWLFRGGDPDRPVLIYQYHPSRSGKIPLNYLNGYQGYIQTDAYKGYDALGRQKGVVMVGCWAHARRKFAEVVKAKGNVKKKGLAEEALDKNGRLYALEKQARRQGLDPLGIYELRQEKSRPILDDLKAWLDEKSIKTPPKGLLGKAINYALGQWHRLVRYIDDGRLRPDNNIAENAIRPFVLGRKNWLFSGHPRGAEATAILYGLVETAKANGLKPYPYLRYLFQQFPFAESEADYRRLLPMYVDPSLLDPPIETLQ